MYLKRLYKLRDDGELVRDEKGEPTVIGVRVLTETKNGVQKFTPNLVEGGAAEGWLSVANGKITIHGENGDCVYAIKRPPGYYCCHCQKKLSDGAGQPHVTANHKDVVSLDRRNPSGYRKDNFYYCTKEGA